MIQILSSTFLRKHIVQVCLKLSLLIGHIFKSQFRSVVCAMFLMAVFAPALISAQNTQVNYKVKFNGEEIGWLKLEKHTVGNKENLLLTSEIKTKIVFPITVFSKESSIFENGKLIFSSQFRKTNGSTKVDKQTKLVGNIYEVFEDGEMGKLSFPFINNNILSLYFHEPVNLKTVFCDKRSSYVNITKTIDGGYEMKFSNGNSNVFYYKDGICSKIMIEHLFYTAEIIYTH